ncbi:hypothetical protein JNUCC1_00923 [Lentibacillus sp. JNUCC-1]|uniref:helix-turn-helix domain-containing protein n=1 Tax=Lentibacillus sp. JNUCC-1 TaxID=2654513 RepID=UPI0012E90131|nr:helix-turn-helix domain-containing protein [Lentibacillus sp. JNUCC-1]MUV37117.1 hypothetical protein [Lentibacillus sp. JNUCC-1]
MSVAILEEFDKDIDAAYKENNQSKIEKETFTILSTVAMFMMELFKDRLKRVVPDINHLDFNKSFITSEKNHEALLHWLKQIDTITNGSVEDIEFGKFKVDFEKWFYEIGGTNIQFEYHDSYLITPGEAAEQLGVSTVTINNYVKRGFEYMNHRSHRRIPKHMIPLWKDPVYSIKIQMMYQQQKLLHQKPEERLKEVMEEILSFQIKYQAGTVKKAIKEVDGDKPDLLTDYYEWESLEEERQELEEQVFGEQTGG